MSPATSRIPCRTLLRSQRHRWAVLYVNDQGQYVVCYETFTHPVRNVSECETAKNFTLASLTCFPVDADCKEIKI